MMHNEAIPMRTKMEKLTLGFLAAALASLSLACSETPREKSDDEAALYEQDLDATAESGTFREDTGEPSIAIELPEEDPTAEREAALVAREREVAQREAELAWRARQAAQQPAPQPAPEQLRYEPEPAREPEPEPQPEPTPVTVAAGTSFSTELTTNLSSETSQVGDRFTALLASPLSGGGREAVPAGAVVEGRVVEVEATKKIGGRARLGLVFDTVVLPDGAQAPLSATLSEVGESQTKKDAIKIGAGTAAGALLGRVIGGGSKTKRSALGAIIGGAVGTVLAARDEGEPIELPAGTVLTLSLEAPLTVMR